MGINIEVSTTGKEFFAGEVVKGVVNVNVDAVRARGVAVSGANLAGGIYSDSDHWCIYS